jgi:CubicO group peptidase (beta-lactamase class C family)
MLSKKLIESSYLARYFLLNTVDISDYVVFPSRGIGNSPPEFHFSPSGNGNALLPTLNQIVPASAKKLRAETIDQFLEHNGTTAFLVIHDDKLLFERYYNGYQHSSICTSFSTAKSFVSALIGIALQERLIRNIEDPITMYLPELTAPFWSQISVRHLVSMSSGLKYNSNGFFPWNDEPRVYYSLNLRQLAKQAKSVEIPGMRFNYNNYNLILLGMIIERVTSSFVSEYLQEKIWKPLGMELSASWSLDSQRSGMEKMESGLNACAVDFAKFGRLYLRRGDWNGKQIIPESWIVESTTVTSDAKWTNYKYLWWISRTGKGRFTAVGNLGQFIFIAPDKNCVIVRFGRGKPSDWKSIYPQLFGSLVDML